MKKCIDEVVNSTKRLLGFEIGVVSFILQLGISASAVDTSITGARR